MPRFIQKLGPASQKQALPFVPWQSTSKVLSARLAIAQTPGGLVEVDV
jgi:hypothetical protein